ncbi:DUF5357 family protein [Phormidium tenue FACHB-886]|nr:DUF5357 family protein [Phormidium tenue FACHB-886]
MDIIGKLIDTIIKQIRAIKPFSWQVSLLLSLFSWFTYLLVRDPAVKQFVSLFAWFFLIVGVDWWLIKKEFTIPGIGFKFYYGPWVTGALAVCALWSNRWGIQDIEGALISYPLFSVFFAAIPRFLKPGFNLKTPDNDTRKDLVVLVLLGILFSGWFRFHFVLQDYLQNYPSVAADNIDRSAFVTRFNPNNIPPTNGVKILNSAESIIRNELAKRSWQDGQRWLTSLSSQASTLAQQVITTAYQETPTLPEQTLWRFNAQFSRSLPTNLLQLQAFWTGPSSQGNGYLLQKSCAISEATVQPFVPGTTPPPTPPLPTPVAYQMDCGAIESSAPGVNIKEPESLAEQTGNLLERLLDAIVNLFRGIVNALGRLLGVGRGEG